MRIACFAMSFADHFNGVLVVVEELVRAGAKVRVWTDATFKSRIEAVGAEFADLFAVGSLDSVDDKSSPRGARGVSFAAAHGHTLTAETAAFRPQLLIHDSFAFIGRVVAEQLELPRVIVTAGHAVDAAAFRAALPNDPRVSIDRVCLDAVERLKSEYRIDDASPFSYVADPSPWLNICKEPSEWVNATERAFLGPIACFGALPRDAMERGTTIAVGAGLRLYAAFGTVIWRYWPNQALRALEAVADGLAGLPDTKMVVGLGGAQVEAIALAGLRGRGVVVHKYADQWTELRDADLFVTHHGLGSTHEAVACAVPMLSLPFFWDQPALARRAQQFGLAVPLIDGVVPEAHPSQDAVRIGLERATENRDAMLDQLRAARTWEARTIAARPEIARQIMAIAR
jgi:UDP:flavonoid glycosyltransferase YjiC (YdhE family)